MIRCYYLDNLQMYTYGPHRLPAILGEIATRILFLLRQCYPRVHLQQTNAKTLIMSCKVTMK